MSGGVAGGGPAQRPPWASLLEPHPDYNNSRIVLLDANTFIDVIGRASKKFETPGLDRWTNEMSWLFNSPASEVKIKVNDQVYSEVVGAGAAAKAPVADVLHQRNFVNTYRGTGKIILDRGDVPFYGFGRETAFRQTFEVLKGKGLSAPDHRIATDGIVNRIRIVTRDFGVLQGLDNALRNKEVKAVLKAHQLPNDVAKILIWPERSGV